MTNMAFLVRRRDDGGSNSVTSGGCCAVSDLESLPCADSGEHRQHKRVVVDELQVRMRKVRGKGLLKVAVES